MGGRQQSNFWLEARHSGRRLMRHGKYLLGHDPLLLPILLRLTPLGISRQITANTELVVEGFPRSGNTFTVFALQDAASNQIQLSSHVHHPSQVKHAVMKGIPVVLVVREPISVLSSYLTYGPHGRARDVLKEYHSYHQELVPYVDRVLVLDFEEIVSDMPAAILRINRRFSLKIPPFDQSSENVERVFADISRQHHLVHPGLNADEVAPRPTEVRRQISDQHRVELLDSKNDELREQCESVYQFFAGKALEQRALFRKSAPARELRSKGRHTTSLSPEE
jgi:hypothetical protein